MGSGDALASSMKATLLPKTSTVIRTCTVPDSGLRIETFYIYKWNPDRAAAKPYMPSCILNPNKTGPLVLGALIRIKNEIDPILTF